MIVTTRTIVSFKLPEEYVNAVDFERRSDWFKSEDTQFISFTNSQTYIVELKGGEEE